MKQFSLLTIIENNSVKLNCSCTGSIHRLQQSVIRRLCTKEDSLYIPVCIRVICSQWKYSLYDARTWSDCAEWLPHIETLSHHISSRLRTSPKLEESSLVSLIDVLNACGCYSATSSSQYVVSQKFLQLAAKVFENGIMPYLTSNSDIRKWYCRSNLLHTLGKVFRYQGDLLNANCMLDLALQLEYQMLRFLLAQNDVIYYDSNKISFALSRMIPIQSLIAMMLELTEEGVIVQFSRLVPNSVTALSLFSAASTTLHELGVLYVRLRSTAIASKLFKAVLQMKSAFRSIASHMEAAVAADSFHCDAAALHQLGAIAINDREYDYAEECLHAAFYLEYENQSNCHSKSATVVDRTRKYTVSKLVEICLCRCRISI